MTAPPQGAVRAEEVDGKAGSLRWKTQDREFRKVISILSLLTNPKTGMGFEFEVFAVQCQILPGCWVKKP